MTSNTGLRSLWATVGPLWAPADEGGTGATSGDTTAQTTDTTGAGKTADAGTKVPSGEVVLGGVAEVKTEGGTTKTDDAKGETAKAEQTPEEKAAAEAEAKLNAVPEDGVYEFTMPEGVELPDDKKEFWSKEFKEAGLTQKQAAKIVELQAGLIVKEMEANNAALEDQQVQHLTAAKADKEIGGAKWDETVKLANRGLAALGGEEIKKLILVTGNGNNPEMLRELRRIGERFADDKFTPGPQVSAEVPPQKKWYGETTPDTKKG